MSATTSPRNTVRWGDNLAVDLFSIPVKAAAKINPGAIVCIDSSGFAVPASTALGLVAIGRCDNTSPVDNTTGANGDLVVLVRPGTFSYYNSGSSDAVLSTTPPGSFLYLVDDQTIALTDGNGTRSFAGRLASLDTTSASAPGVYVTIDYFLSPLGTGGGQRGKISATITQAALVAKGAVTSGVFTVGVLPAGARLMGFSVGEPTFTGLDNGGGATYTVSIEDGAGSTADIMAALNVATGQTGFPKIGTIGAHGFLQAPHSAATITATVASNANLSGVTAGNLVVNVWYIVD